jgi:catechol 2,3-dioxygenase-like lactoylglutathione lyase family enzyme
MTGSAGLQLHATVLGAPDPLALADFYGRLLGWAVRTKEPDWVTLANPNGGPGLSFQLEDDYRRPVWPEKPGEQQMLMHLDILVEDLPAACDHAEAAGAELAGFQPQDDVRVYFDPAGHPFCLFEN